MRNHTIVVGYGTKGRTAVQAMVGDEVAPGDIVVVDENPAALDRARAAGLVTVVGDATKSEVLRLAGAQHAKSIVVATDKDATAVLVTLTAREVAPKAKIVASAREAENQHLLRQSGADSTVVSSETAGRLLGIATQTPSVVEMVEDLLTPDAGFAISEREVEVTTWDGWLELDAHERALGAAHEHTRERVKVVPREEQVEISRSGALSGTGASAR